MVIAAFVCFFLLIGGWFMAPSSIKEQVAETPIKPTDMKVTVTP